MANGYDLVQVKTVGENSINYEIIQENDVIYGIENHNIDFVVDQYLTTIITNSVTEKYKTYTPKNEGGKISEELKDHSFTQDNKTFYLDEKDLTFNIRRNNTPQAISGHINVVYNEAGECVGWSLLSSYEENSGEFATQTYKYTFVEAFVGCSIPVNNGQNVN